MRIGIICGIVLSCSILSVLRAEETAADLETKGIAALKQSQDDPDALIAACVNFGASAALYEKNGEAAKLVELNSYLYWCKKKMTLRQMNEFLKGEGDKAQTAIERLKIFDKDEPADSDAQNYFDRADLYAGAHPDEHLLIAVRFFEVAERFKSTPVNAKALERSLQELSQSSANPATIPPPAANVTSPGKPAGDAVKKTPAPTAAQQKESDKVIRELFKSELSKTAPADKLAAARKFVKQAEETKDDSSARFVLLSIAANLAAQAEALDEMMAIIDNLESKFEGDYDALAKSNLAVLIASTKNPALTRVAQAQKTLLDKPNDPAANLALGKFLTFVKNDVEKGLALIVKANNPVFSKAAALDLKNPTETAAQTEAGDAWWEIAEKTADKDEKRQIQERARVWYQKAIPSLTGLAKTKLEMRIESIAAATQPSPPVAPVASKTNPKSPAPSATDDKGPREIPTDDLMAELLGKWTTPKYGPWTFTYKDGKFELSTKDNRSIECLRSNNGIVFHWSDSDNAIWVEKKGETITISCFNKYMKNHTVRTGRPGTRADWSYKMEREK